MKKYYKAIPFVTAIIIDEEGKFLIGKHPFDDDKPFPGRWDLLAGKLKENESFEECVIREIKEEAGFDVASLEIYKVHHNFGDNLPDISPLTSVCVCYKVEVTGDFVPDELDDMHFADVEELKTMKFTPWTEVFLEDFIK